MIKDIFIETTLQKIVGCGQTIGEMDDGRKVFAWGGLPGERVKLRLTKRKSKFAEGIVTEIIESSEERSTPRDPDSFLSTSPWQIMTYAAEEKYKRQLIEEAMSLSDITVDGPIKFFQDDNDYHYRNKVEFSWWWDNDLNRLDLAFFKRGSHTKVPVDGTSLAHEEINQVARNIRDILRRKGTAAFNLKTLILRCDQSGNVVAQLYVKKQAPIDFSEQELSASGLSGFEIIFSNPKSPASIVTKRLFKWGSCTLSDSVLDVPFFYTAESFFQINIPVYEHALQDIAKFVPNDQPLVDLYSGVGTIGLTIGNSHTTLVESNLAAVAEMKNNIVRQHSRAIAIAAPSEKALEYIDSQSTIIVDPPRAGLHSDVIDKLLEACPPRIIYLSCNPVTQGRDVAQLLKKYHIIHQHGYNFFPRTPHIENLIVLDRKK